MQARKKDSLLVASVKDSLGAAVITFALACVMVGLRVDVASGRGAELFLEHRWLAVAVAVLVVFAGRLAMNIFFWKREDPPSLNLSGLLPKGGLGGGSSNVLKYGLVVLAVALPFALMFWLGARGSRQYIDLAILVMTYVMLGWGLNIVVGLAGLLDLGYVAFYAVGAYSYALLAHYFGFSFWLCLPLAGILAAFWGVILGFPVLRLRGDYLAIVTLAFGEIIRVVLLNWYQFTGGPDGLSGIPRPSFFRVGIYPW